MHFFLATSGRLIAADMLQAHYTLDCKTVQKYRNSSVCIHTGICYSMMPWPGLSFRVKF